MRMNSTVSHSVEESPHSKVNSNYLLTELLRWGEYRQLGHLGERKGSL